MSAEKKAAAGVGSGCLMLFLFCGGCLGLSVLVGPSDRLITQQAPAPEPRAEDVAAPKLVSKEPESAPAVPPQATPADELVRFAHACDALLAEIDSAWESGRFSGVNRTENLAEWGGFIRSVNGRIRSMQEVSAGFSPPIAKIQVGSIAGYLQSLTMDIVKQDPAAFPKFREYVGGLVAERDAYLKGIMPEYLSAPERRAANAARSMEEWQRQRDLETEKRKQAADAYLRESMAEDEAKKRADLEAGLMDSLSFVDLGSEPLSDVAAEDPGPELYTWSDSTGKFSVVAEYVGIKSGKVRLRKTDGSEIEVLLDRLSEEDQKFAKDLFKAIRNVESEHKRKERLSGRGR